MTYCGLEQQLRQVKKEIERAKVAIIDNFLNVDLNAEKERFSEKDIQFEYLNFDLPTVQQYRNLVIFKGKHIMVLHCLFHGKSKYYFYGAISQTEMYELLQSVRAIITGKEQDMYRTSEFIKNFEKWNG